MNPNPTIHLTHLHRHLSTREKLIDDHLRPPMLAGLRRRPGALPSRANHQQGRRGRKRRGRRGGGEGREEMEEEGGRWSDQGRRGEDSHRPGRLGHEREREGESGEK